FDGEDDVQVLYQQIHDMPPTLRQLLPDAPEALERVLTRALAKEPSQRYPNVAELARALESSVFTVGVTRPPRGREELYPAGEDGRTLPRMKPGLMAPPAPRRALGGMALVGLFALAAGMAGTFAVLKLGPRATPQSGFLLVSEPPGATVVLDGKPL